SPPVAGGVVVPSPSPVVGVLWVSPVVPPVVEVAPSTEVQAVAIKATTASNTSQIRLVRMVSSSFSDSMTDGHADHPLEMPKARLRRLVGTSVLGWLLA